MYWMIAAIVVVFGVALLGRAGLLRPSTRRQSRRVGPLKPGESYDTAVKLATLPNVPLADLWCQRLREEGIEAFHKSSPYPISGIYGGAAVNPAVPVEVWIGQHDVERARQLFPELA